MYASYYYYYYYVYVMIYVIIITYYVYTLPAVHIYTAHDFGFGAAEVLAFLCGEFISPFRSSFFVFFHAGVHDFRHFLVDSLCCVWRLHDVHHIVDNCIVVQHMLDIITISMILHKLLLR